MVTVGCTPLVTNYNMLLNTEDKRVAAQVTRSVREKDGGLPWVRAYRKLPPVILNRPDQVACSLLL